MLLLNNCVAVSLFRLVLGILQQGLLLLEFQYCARTKTLFCLFGEFGNRKNALDQQMDRFRDNQRQLDKE